MATLYVVATPIGNLADITLRAAETLRSVDVVLCEDTRTTKHLLDHYHITGPQLVAYNEKESGVTISKIVEYLRDDKDIALVSDAGTPTLSDPGARLVHEVHEAGFGVVPIPGPSALIAALSVAGVPASDFLFLGFLPHKKGRQTLFNEIRESKRTVVLYESPHRILKTLDALAEVLSPQRRVVVVRELTKIHEEVVSGTPEKVQKYFQSNSEKVRGEFVVVVSSK